MIVAVVKLIFWYRRGEVNFPINLSIFQCLSLFHSLSLTHCHPSTHSRHPALSLSLTFSLCSALCSLCSLSLTHARTPGTPPPLPGDHRIVFTRTEARVTDGGHALAALRARKRSPACLLLTRGRSGRWCRTRRRPPGCPDPPCSCREIEWRGKAAKGVPKQKRRLVRPGPKRRDRASLLQILKIGNSDLRGLIPLPYTQVLSLRCVWLNRSVPSKASRM